MRLIIAGTESWLTNIKCVLNLFSTAFSFILSTHGYLPVLTLNGAEQEVVPEGLEATIVYIAASSGCALEIVSEWRPVFESLNWVILGPLRTGTLFLSHLSCGAGSDSIIHSNVAVSFPRCHIHKQGNRR